MPGPPTIMLVAEPSGPISLFAIFGLAGLGVVVLWKDFLRIIVLPKTLIMHFAEAPNFGSPLTTFALAGDRRHGLSFPSQSLVMPFAKTKDDNRPCASLHRTG